MAGPTGWPKTTVPDHVLVPVARGLVACPRCSNPTPTGKLHVLFEESAGPHETVREWGYRCVACGYGFSGA